MPQILTKTLLCGLVACGFSLSACQGGANSDGADNFSQTSTRPGDKVVARVNGTKIFLSDVERAATGQGLVSEGVPLTPSDPTFQKTLEELIDQRLLALDAMSQSLDQTDETKRRLSAARERILGNIRVEDHLQNTVNEVTIRKMYDAQSDIVRRGEERRARHILVEDKAEADAIFKSLEDGADFAALAQEKSLDNGSAAKGGDLGFFSLDMLDGRFTRPVFKAKIGDRLPPFKTEFGWHVVEVRDSRLPEQPSFEALKPEIVNFMTFEAIQTLLSDLRKTGEVEFVYQTLEPETPTLDPGNSKDDTTEDVDTADENE
ncbi:peptidylprolyl isomerase [Litorimonas sp. RW-G-Af-16]|uniref:peptidylprolyl isomerase n=1 Tax=Litorimonas sp. RW-G-Af-16 TaxID=3241168 RepID=UPI00390CC48F